MKRHMLKLFIPPIEHNLLAPEIKILQIPRYLPIGQQPRYQNNPRNNLNQDNDRSNVFEKDIPSEHYGIEDYSREQAEVRVRQIKKDGYGEVDD